MNWKLWIKAAAVRALKTFAQAILGGIAVGMALKDVDWIHLVSVAAVAAVISILTSLAGLPEVDQQNQVVRYDDDRSDDAPIFEEDN